LYPHNDNIKNALKDSSDFVIKNGLNYLIPKWKKFTNKVHENDGSIIEDYLNDLDTRNIIDKILPLLTEIEKASILQEVNFQDRQFIDRTFELKDCIWGVQNETIHGYTRQKHFYYYRAPQHIIDQYKDILIPELTQRTENKG